MGKTPEVFQKRKKSFLTEKSALLRITSPAFLALGLSGAVTVSRSGVLDNGHQAWLGPIVGICESFREVTRGLSGGLVYVRMYSKALAQDGKVQKV